MQPTKQEGHSKVLTNTEKDILNGAAIGIACAMASSKINKPSSNGRVNYKKLNDNAVSIAEAMLGEPLPETIDAIEGYVESVRGDVYSDKTTIADIVASLNAANEVSEEKLKEAVKEVEKNLSPDMLTLRHVDEKTESLCNVIGQWEEQNYEHERRVASLPRPEFKSALAAARKTGVDNGFYDKNGGLSDKYMSQFTDPIAKRRDELLVKWDEMVARGDNGLNAVEEGTLDADIDVDMEETVAIEPVTSGVNAHVGGDVDGDAVDTVADDDAYENGRLIAAVDAYDVTELDEPDDNFFANIAEQLEHPLHDMSGFDVLTQDYSTYVDGEYDETQDTEEIEEMSASAETAVMKPVKAMSSAGGDIDGDGVDGDGNDADMDAEGDIEDVAYIEDAAEGEVEIVHDADGEEIEVPPAEVLEVLEPEPVKDPTEPIVMDAEVIAEAIAEESQDMADGTIVAEVAEALVEEMAEAAELDPEECKSFTDQFMAVEIGEDGHARAKKPVEDDDAEKDIADEEAVVAKAEAVDETESDDSVLEVDVEETGEETSTDGSDDVEVDVTKEKNSSQDIEEEILDLAAKTRSAIKKAVNNR